MYEFLKEQLTHNQFQRKNATRPKFFYLEFFSSVFKLATQQLLCHDINRKTRTGLCDLHLSLTKKNLYISLSKQHCRSMFLFRKTRQIAWPSSKSEIVPIKMQSLQRYQRRLCEIMMQHVQLLKRTNSVENNFHNSQCRVFVACIFQSMLAIIISSFGV